MLAVRYVIVAYPLDGRPHAARPSRAAGTRCTIGSLRCALIVGGLLGLLIYDAPKWAGPAFWSVYQKSVLGGTVLAFVYLCVAFRKRSPTG